MGLGKGTRRRLIGVATGTAVGALTLGLLVVPNSYADPDDDPLHPPVGTAPIVPPLPIPAPPQLPFVPPLRPLPQFPLPFPAPLNVVPPVPLLPQPAPANVTVVASAMQIPWDVAFMPDGRALIGDRSGRLRVADDLTRPGAAVVDVDADLSDVTAFGEGGLSGLAVHPDFARNRTFYTCIDSTRSGKLGTIRLVQWEFLADGGTANRLLEPPLDGVPLEIDPVFPVPFRDIPNPDALTDLLPGTGPGPAAKRIAEVFIGPELNPTGFHIDCRPRFGPDGMLYVGVGDSVQALAPQDRTNLGGKVLRIDPATNGPAPGNPFINSPNANERLVWSYGHRNIQGVAFQPGTGRLFTGEHGPDHDDEVNLIVKGGNYGWDPSRGGDVVGITGALPEGGFAPMTDKVRYPNAIDSMWSSGFPTVAASGIAFLEDPRWGPRQGMLAVATLKGSALLLMRLAPDGKVTSVETLPELDQTFGRLRSMVNGPDGALYVTTSNGFDDKVLRVAPF